MFLTYLFLFVFLGKIATKSQKVLKTKSQVEIDILFDRLKQQYVDSGSYSLSFGDPSSDGSWADINYADTSRTGWIPQKHVSRIEYMTRAYSKPSSSSYQDPTLFANIEKALNYWYDRKPTSDNWWWLDIGQCGPIGRTLIMLKHELSSSVIDKGVLYLTDEPWMTGANLIDVATQTIQRGVVTDDLELIKKGINAMSNEISIHLDEGIQEDYSFHQHGAQLYSGGYGIVFLDKVTYFMYMTRQLSFTFSQEKIDIIEKYILEGDRWMIYKKYYDVHVGGRGFISRPGSGRSSAIKGCLEEMIELKTDREQELQEFLDHINADEKENSPTVYGSKYFWVSDYHTHRRENYFLGIRMTSTRTIGYENTNNENLKGQYFCLGSTVLMKDSLEYYYVYPNLDYTKLSGITAPSDLPSSTKAYRGDTNFVGAVTNGYYGFVGMDVDFSRNEDNIHILAKKSWFLFDNEVVALGTGIDNGNTGKSLTTSVMQSLLRTDVKAKINSNEESITFGNHAPSSLQWIMHSGFGYFFPNNPTNVKIDIEHRTNNWNEIGVNTRTQENDIFSVYFDHGSNFANEKGDYSYQIITKTNLTKEDMKKYETNNPIEIISNTEEIQAVRHKDLNIYEFIFYQPEETTNNRNFTASITTNDGLSVTVNSGCFLMIKIDGNVEISVSNPLQNLTLNLELSIPGYWKRSFDIELPSDAYVGKSVVTEFQPLSIAGTFISITIGICLSFFLIIFLAIIVLIILIFAFKTSLKKKEDSNTNLEMTIP